MARRDQPTAGARVSRDVMDVFEAAMFARRLKMQALLEPFFERLANELRDDPDVKEALDLRARVDAERGADVHDLRRPGDE